MAELARRGRPSPLEKYRGDPAGYVRDILKQRLTPKQEEALVALTEPPFVALCPSGNNTGKSFAGACAASWWFDCFRPSLVLTTAPTERQVEGILWRELRKVRGAAGLGNFCGPRACRMEDGDGRRAIGLTARDESAFQGWHDKNVLIIFDEAEGIAPAFWEAAQSMLGGERYAMLCLYNPTTATSRASEEELLPNRRIIYISALEHPNIAEELAGRPAPFPSAIRLARLRELIVQWCEQIDPGDFDLTKHDFFFDALDTGEEQCWRPSLAGCARILGKRHPGGIDEVFPPALWDAVCKTRLKIQPSWPLQLGCDVGAFGDDPSAIHVRRGLCALWHESHLGWPPERTAGRLKVLATHYAGEAGLNPKAVPILVDMDGPGYGVLSHADDFSFLGIHSAGSAYRSTEYYLKRTELYFHARDVAEEGFKPGSPGPSMDVSRLSRAVRDELRRQLCGVKYRLRPSGQFEVERKEETKRRIKRSPDDADGFLLAWYPPPVIRDWVSGRV